MISNKKICFIGGGSMAEAIISGIQSKELLPPENISVVNRSNKERLHNLADKYKININICKKDAISNADIIFLAVKPKDIKECLNEISTYINNNQLIISVIAGVTTHFISKYLDYKGPVIRTMPNTSAMIGLSATGMAIGENATDEDFQVAKKVLEAVGTVTLVKEEQINAVTALSGSGPAYFYYFVEALEKAAIQLGLDNDTARELSVQTIIGAGQMLKETGEEPAILRSKVTSPNGTTMAGIETMEKYKVHDAIISGVKQASERAKELGVDE